MAERTDILWFTAGLICGIVGTLGAGTIYLTGLTHDASAAKKSAPRGPESASAPAPWSASFQKMISRQSVEVPSDQFLFIRGPDGVAALMFESSEPSSARYRWRCLPRTTGTVQSGSASVRRDPGDELLATLKLGPIQIDWLGRGSAGTVLYYDPKSFSVEKHPLADFDSLDLTSKLDSSPSAAAAKP